VITIGIDPHKSSHTAVALDEAGRVLGELRVVATMAMLARLLHWAERWPERVWAVEGAAGLGHLLAQRLVAREETVLDVPATLAARARLLARGHGRKTDGIDAASVARVAQSQPGLRRVSPEDHSAVLRLLSDRRDELTGERSRAVNRLHRLLRDLRPGGAPTELSTEAAARLLNRIRPKTAVDLEAQADGSCAGRRPATGRPGPRREPGSVRRGRRRERHHAHDRLRHQRRPRGQDPGPCR
jgi:hypothetical protein